MGKNHVLQALEIKLPQCCVSKITECCCQ